MGRNEAENATSKRNDDKETRCHRNKAEWRAGWTFCVDRPLQDPSLYKIFKIFDIRTDERRNLMKIGEKGKDYVANPEAYLAYFFEINPITRLNYS
jgi:hypothetical protein